MTDLQEQFSKEEQNRAIQLTNIVALVLFFLSIIVGFGYYLSTASDRIHWWLWLFSPIFILPFLLNSIGFINLSRFLLSTILTVFVMYLSISLKTMAQIDNIINPVNYFDVRIILLNAAIIPLILFSLNEKRLMLFALMPSYFSLVFFDVIHNGFGVGYYQSGLTSPDYYFSANMFTLVTLIFITSVLLQLKKQVRTSEYSQLIKNHITRSYLTELIKISNSPNINNGQVDEAKKEILRSVKHCLNVSRVSIWQFNKEDESITCEYFMENDHIISPGTVLYAKDYPTYFVELKYQQLIIARDARNDSKTEEFRDEYLIPNDIYSLMDAPFLRRRSLGGVICCEHQGEFKEWGAAESLVLKALGDFLSYTIIVNERIKQNKLLQEKNEEITTINEGLEQKVKSRTQELEYKNKQLSEYAFINAHVLKAPIARISGLFNIFKFEARKNKGLNKEVMNYMEGSIEELKSISTKINNTIEEHGTIDRKKLFEE